MLVPTKSNFYYKNHCLWEGLFEFAQLDYSSINIATFVSCIHGIFKKNIEYLEKNNTIRTELCLPGSSDTFLLDLYLLDTSLVIRFCSHNNFGVRIIDLSLF